MLPDSRLDGKAIKLRQGRVSAAGGWQDGIGDSGSRPGFTGAENADYR